MLVDTCIGNDKPRAQAGTCSAPAPRDLRPRLPAGVHDRRCARSARRPRMEHGRRLATGATRALPVRAQRVAYWSTQDGDEHGRSLRQRILSSRRRADLFQRHRPATLARAHARQQPGHVLAYVRAARIITGTSCTPMAIARLRALRYHPAQAARRSRAPRRSGSAPPPRPARATSSAAGGLALPGAPTPTPLDRKGQSMSIPEPSPLQPSRHRRPGRPVERPATTTCSSGPTRGATT
jgi:hypothetical protein